MVRSRPTEGPLPLRPSRGCCVATTPWRPFVGCCTHCLERPLCVAERRLRSRTLWHSKETALMCIVMSADAHHTDGDATSRRNTTTKLCNDIMAYYMHTTRTLRHAKGSTRPFTRIHNTPYTHAGTVHDVCGQRKSTRTTSPQPNDAMTAAPGGGCDVASWWWLGGGLRILSRCRGTG